MVDFHSLLLHNKRTYPYHIEQFTIRAEEICEKSTGVHVIIRFDK